MEKVSIEENNTFWNRFDLSRPSIESRLQKIEKALYDRGIEIDTIADTRKVTPFDVLHVQYKMCSRESIRTIWWKFCDNKRDAYVFLDE